MTASTALPFVAIAVLVLAVACLLALLARATTRLDVSRSVRIHATPEQVWRAVGHVPDLYARHAKLRGLGRIEAWTLRHGDGGAGSLWRGSGTLGGAAFWTEVEVVRAEPGRVLELALAADSLGTEGGLRAHRAVMSLEPVGAGMTRLTWTLQAHLRGVRLRLLRLLAASRVRALLLDHGLRSIKAHVEAATGAAGPAPPPGPAPALPAAGSDASAGRPSAAGNPAPAGGGTRPPEAAL
jgi:uncharacterized protein YndB with AHSA1/START domain